MMNRKSVLVLFSTIALMASGSFIGSLKAAPGPVQTSGEQPPKKAEEQFKNIQVLKGVPADQLFPSMQFITASLGVECDFCHVQGAFEKDDKKPKAIARKMMEMMFAINQENFDGHRAVTCYSCHRGNAKPMAIPVVMSDEPKEAMTGAGMGTVKPENDTKETKDARPAADQLIDKYLQAAGGAPAIDKVTSRVMKGTIDFGGKSLPIDIYAKAPDERISFTHMPEGDSVTAFNGHEGWLGTPGRPIREMHGGDLDGASIDADLHFASHLTQMFSEVHTQGSEKIGDQEAYVVVGKREGKTPIILYLDKQSGLLVRLVRYGDTALGWLPTQIDYADYRDASGVKVPYRWTLARPSGRFTIQVTELKQNVPVDDAKFVKPATQPEPPKPSAK